MGRVYKLNPLEPSVECQICHRRLRTLRGHLPHHGLDARAYRIQFPGSDIKPTPTRRTPRYTSWVTCKLCGKKFQSLFRHLATHGVSAEQYRKQFPRAPLQIKELRREQSERMDVRFGDPKYHDRITGLLAAYKQTPKYKVRQTAASIEVLKRQNPSVDRWTQPEKLVRTALRDQGLYKTGHEGGVGFLPHRWLPTKGFVANGDFVDYNHKLLIHVDGYYWHGKAGSRANDRRLDRWCLKNGWRYLRLTDTAVIEKPRLCARLIRRFVAGDVFVLVH